MLINSWLIVGKRHILPCVSYIYCRVPVYCVYVLVIVDFLLLSFKLILGWLFSPHHVNQGGVQKTTPQVTLYKSHTAKESLRRHRAGRHNHVLTCHPGQVWELCHCHQRITHSMCGWPPRLPFLLQHDTHVMREWPHRLEFLLQLAGTLPSSSLSFDT